MIHTTLLIFDRLTFGISLQVSWVRGKDSHILYIGDVRFVDDSRFELLRSRERSVVVGGDHRSRGSSSFSASGDWTLKVRFVQAEDEGDFECQLSTSPKLSKTFRINVVGEYKVLFLHKYSVFQISQ